MSFLRLNGLALTMAAGLSFVAVELAEARIGGGKSFGSRGSRTYDAPAGTKTAPGAAPVDRSMTDRGAPNAAQTARAPAPQAAAQPSRFGGWRGILMGGLFVAALGGIFGFGALANMLGFLLQFALIAGILYLAFSFFRSRFQLAAARASAAGGNARPGAHRLNRASLGSAAGGGMAVVSIGQPDLDSFERLLGEIQTAYSREDAEALGERATPEMLSYFLGELSDLQSQGLRNEISDVKLLQGDLAEAWREAGTEYATVAMRYALKDVTRDRATGRIVSGDEDRPAEVTELWTFRRDDRTRAEGWQLSAIQQAA